jgi:hypothetical protein
MESKQELWLILLGVDGQALCNSKGEWRKVVQGQQLHSVQVDLTDGFLSNQSLPLSF